MNITIKELQKAVNQTAKESGWWDGELGELDTKRLCSIIALIHSELSEALECIRTDDLVLRFENGKPEGLPSEFADAVIRIMDVCEQLGINLEEALIIKDNYNRTRSYRHGGKSI